MFVCWLLHKHDVKFPALLFAGKVVLELGRDTLEQLWHRYPASLEQEVLSVLELVCQNPELSIQQLQQMVSHRGLVGQFTIKNKLNNYYYKALKNLTFS